MQWADDLKEEAAAGFVDGVNGNVGSGATLVFFDGTLPADVTDPDDGTEIIALDCANPLFTFNSGTFSMQLVSALTDTTAVTGTMQYWRLKNSGGDVLMQGTSGTFGTDIVCSPSDTITGGGALVSVTAFTFPLTVTVPV